MLEIKGRCRDCGQPVTISLDKPIPKYLIKAYKLHVLCDNCKLKYIKDLEIKK